MPPHYLEPSNLYSHQEIMILYWLEINSIDESEG